MAGERVGPYIECPSCGHIDRDTFDYPDAMHRDDGEADMECESCGAEFMATSSLSITYTTTLAAPPPSPPQTDAGAAAVEAPRRCDYCEDRPATRRMSTGFWRCDECAPPQTKEGAP